MLKTALKLSAVSLALSGGILAAHAGGLERSSQDFDILFEEGNVVETGATFVAPQRKLKNIRGSVFPANPVPNQNFGKPFDTEVDEGKTYWVPKLSAKIQLTDELGCAVQYREPWGIDTDSGINNARMFSAIEQEISSRDYGLNCAYRFSAGEKGFFRILGGVSYQELKGRQTKISGVPLDPNNPRNLTFANSTLDVDDSAFGWRLGAAYEIPEIALRASLVYQSKVNYDLDGTVGVSLIGAPLNFLTPVSGSVATPQSVEFKFQTGIAPDWLALASIKWTDWKSITKIGFNNSGDSPFLGGRFPVGSEVTSLDLYYKDGWTVMGGIGHKFNDKWSGAATVTWDRGTTTGLTSQTDVWLLGLGANYKATQHLEFRLAGAVGILTSGTLDNTTSAPNGGSPTGSKADFGTDVVGGMTLSAKYRF
ncbi:transporter [Pseudochrobactrum algeriensis]|uniref:OmpP1/FadL family transporter n=1 Tax=Pseudochrobactrum algeriensis TaxID=2834768 RepID=UPI001BCF63E2|nr:OmpP1/FadL family transporter [Pseudochrobactrum algeriensis]MBX8811268.1 transporter [Ochrobactrum sp. MR34]QVQ38118.1 transporter [Pseudochrobactrum algeriensis]QVQ41343.1 transporter [Pseudochrobactrum algeriensis]QVQ45266.1 transporter [Pseudochrobactrum algeriensis]